MNESGVETRETNFHGKVEDVYCQLLGMDGFPKSPTILPEEVLLPPSCMGNLESGILAGYEDGKERSWYIDFDGNSLVKSDVLIGSEEDVGGESVKEKHRHERKGQKALISYHTHPLFDQSLSDRDIAIAIAYTKESLISIVAAGGGIIALFQTSECLEFRHPRFLSQFIIENKLKKMGEDVEKKLGYLVKEGFGVYFWTPLRLDRTRKWFGKGDLDEGLTLKRYIPPTSSSAST